MRVSLITVRVMSFLLFLLGVGSVLFGLYHAILLPIDYGNQQSLSQAVPCSVGGSNCTRTLTATVREVINDGGNEGTLALRIGGSQVSLTAVQSYNTMERLYPTEQIQVVEWRGSYVHVITPVGSFDTVDNPGYPVSQDIAFGIVGVLLGIVSIWMFGRSALSPIFMALGRREFASPEDRALDDLKHGIVPNEPLIAPDGFTRWAMRFGRWEAAHPVLDALLFMAFATGMAALRASDNPGGLTGNPHWQMILGVAAALGFFVWLLLRFRSRRTDRDLSETERLRQRLQEVSTWPDSRAKDAAMLEIATSLEGMLPHRRHGLLSRRR